jgi:hypothetical protein
MRGIGCKEGHVDAHPSTSEVSGILPIKFLWVVQFTTIAIGVECHFATCGDWVVVDLRKVSSSSLRVLKSSVDLWWAPNNAWTTTTTLSF